MIENNNNTKMIEECEEGLILTEDVITLKEADEWVNTERSPEEYLKLHDDLIQKIYNLRGKVEYDYPLATHKNKYYCTHVHHIDFQSEGGGNEKANLVVCTPLEHTTLHLLKYRSNPNNYIYALAACLMANPRANNTYRGKELTLEEMQEILKFISLDLFEEIKNKSIKAEEVVCYDDEFNIIREFKSTKEASLVFGLSKKTINNSINGRKRKSKKIRHKAGGMWWDYKNRFIYLYPDKYEYFKNLKCLPELNNIQIHRDSRRAGATRIIVSSINSETLIFKIYQSVPDLCKEIGACEVTVRHVLCRDVYWKDGIHKNIKITWEDKWGKIGDESIILNITPNLINLKGIVELKREKVSNIIRQGLEEERKIYNKYNRKIYSSKENKYIIEDRTYMHLKDFVFESLENELALQEFLRKQKEDGKV